MKAVNKEVGFMDFLPFKLCMTKDEAKAVRCCLILGLASMTVGKEYIAAEKSIALLAEVIDGKTVSE